MSMVHELHDCRQAFAQELIEIAARDERIVVVCNDSVGSSNLGQFRAQFPQRLINVGIAEQTMVGVGAGLANAGYTPFVCAAAPFLTARALEQIKADVAYSGLGVTLCAMSPGFAYGELGPTHHSIEDLTWLRALPGLDIVIPADPQQTRQAVRMAAAQPRPAFIRVGRAPVPDVTEPGTELQRGRMTPVRPGRDVTIFAAGPMVARALEAAGLLEQCGVSTAVVNAAYLAPLDEQAIVAAATTTRAIVTAEDAAVSGGLGAAVAGVVATLPAGHRVPVLMAGARQFAPTGTVEDIFAAFDLTPSALVQTCQEALRHA